MPDGDHPAPRATSEPAHDSETTAPAPRRRTQVAPAHDSAAQIAAGLREAARACGASADVECLCAELTRNGFAASPTGAIRTLRWPMPTTTSGSTATEDGIVLVPLGPAFEVTIDGSGAVAACGVTEPTSAAQ